MGLDISNLLFITHIGVALSLFQLSHVGALDYPSTPAMTHLDDYFGVNVDDPYRWLEDGDDPSVKEWDQKQNDLFEECKDSGSTCKSLQAFYKKVWSNNHMTLRVIGDDDKILITYQDPDQHAPVYYIIQNVNEEKKLLLDVNQWPGEHTISYVEPSPRGNFIAFGIVKGGSESPFIYLFDTLTLEPVDEVLHGQGHSSYYP